MKFSTILSSIALIVLSSKASAAAIKDHFLDKTDRADLFTMTDYNIPDIYIEMEKEKFDALIKSASINAFNAGGNIPPPPPPGRRPEGEQGGPSGPGGPGGPGEGEGEAGGPPEGFDNMIINPGSKEEENLKITDASLKFILNGETISIPSISISIGGQHSRNTPKVGFNLKCNKGNLLGRKVFRLRSNDGDPSLMRSKISCDIANRLGFPSISANYARVYINNEFMGLYVLMDHYKTSWIKQVYHDKEVTDLYQCKEMFADLSPSTYLSCVNADDSRPDDKDNLIDFLNTINAAKSRKEIDNIMDVDAFIQAWIFEWLLGSGDHMLINGKNFFLYKQLNGIWTVLYYDFDSMFGVELSRYYIEQSEAPQVPFDKWYSDHPIVDTLAKNDEVSFLKNLQYIVDKAFNPAILFPHIDSVKNWIDQYMLEDRTPVEGVLPGRVNKFGFGNNYNYTQFVDNVEYTSIDNAYGIKDWIQKRYDYICSTYDIQCPNFENKKEIISTIDIEDKEEVTTSAEYIEDIDDIIITEGTEESINEKEINGKPTNVEGFGDENETDVTEGAENPDDEVDDSETTEGIEKSNGEIDDNEVTEVTDNTTENVEKPDNEDENVNTELTNTEDSSNDDENETDVIEGAENPDDEIDDSNTTESIEKSNDVVDDNKVTEVADNTTENVEKPNDEDENVNAELTNTEDSGDDDETNDSEGTENPNDEINDTKTTENVEKPIDEEENDNAELTNAEDSGNDDETNDSEGTESPNDEINDTKTTESVEKPIDEEENGNSELTNAEDSSDSNDADENANSSSDNDKKTKTNKKICYVVKH